MKLSVYIFLMLFSILCSAGQGYTEETFDEKADCTNPTSQAEINICSFREYEEADEELNRIYQKALNIIGDDQTREESFRVAQKSWIEYRDLTCQFEAGPRDQGGTIWPLIYNGCLTRITKERIKNIPLGFYEWDNAVTK